MVKRCIGIEVGPSHLCAVQLLRIGKAFCIEKVFDTQTRRGTDSASETVKALVSKHGFDRRAAVAISMPSETWKPMRPDWSRFAIRSIPHLIMTSL